MRFTFYIILDYFFNLQLFEAAVSMENRDEKLDMVYDLIEKDLVLVGQRAPQNNIFFPFSYLLFFLPLFMINEHY